MRGLQYLPLDVAAMEDVPAFGSDDPALVRASLYLLDAAWRSEQVGSVSADLQALARITRLAPQQVEAAWDQLFAGWALENGRLWHPRLAALGAALRKRYAEELEIMEASQALMMQPHEQTMELIADAKKPSSNRGKRVYPKDFAPDETSLAAMERAGFVLPSEREWLLQKFADFGRASRRMYVDWQAAFRNFLASSITAKDFREAFGYRLGQRPVQSLIPAVQSDRPLSAIERLRASVGARNAAGPAMLAETFAQRQLNNARTMMAAAMAHRQATLEENETAGEVSR